MTRRLGSIGVLLAAVGCGGIEEVGDYESARAEAECKRLEACELGFFQSEYTSADDCVNTRQDDLRDADGHVDDRGCVYDPDQAGFCVDRISGMGCEEWGMSNEGGKACDLVWDCSEAG